MSETNKILAQDLKILEAMVDGMPAYLVSEATHWPMSGDNMPKLTIGGCLMRQERLQQLHNQLAFADQARLNKSIDKFNASLKNQVVRFEGRAHDELHARLREWTTYLHDATSKMATTREHYANIVDTRIVITALMNKLAQPPYQLNARLAQDIAHMDTRLKGQWQTDKFILDEIWQKAYTPAEYWWLYGYPG
ncbi:MAG: hypothetical protein IAF02_14970 [Anaerolineae bacterium]|nr:hypothetical protein [Anaerolineae bacterium]